MICDLPKIEWHDERQEVSCFTHNWIGCHIVVILSFFEKPQKSQNQQILNLSAVRELPPARTVNDQERPHPSTQLI
jgi:hypothetical protein